MVLRICNLVEYLIKINKNPDGLVWTIFGGRSPKVRVNHVKLVVSFVLSCCAGLFSFVLHDDDVMNAI